jgi:uncharacterized repeat protein (TIGR03803 family)
MLTLVSTASAEWKEKVLYSFQGGTNDGPVPAGGVVFDKQGNLYGATTDGGMVYQLAPPAEQGNPWTETVLYTFKGKQYNDGDLPNGGLLIDSQGNLYGVTAYGGSGDCVLLGTNVGCGTVYELSPPQQKGDPWTETILYSFPTAKQGYLPNGDLVFDGDGNLYGATEFGGGKGTTCDPFYQYCGAVFELSPPKAKGGKWTEKVLHAFASGTDGANPNGGLVLDSKGAIYGTTYGGGNESRECGSGGCGTAFELKPPTKKGGAWVEKQLHVFAAGNDGGDPAGNLIFDAKGSLYGAAQGGSSSGGGIVYRLTADGGGWKKTVLHWFSSGPLAGLLFDSVGNLYGTTADGGGEGGGTVFRLRPPTGKPRAWTLDLLYSFTRSPDGAYPDAQLIFGNGDLYGTTEEGGTGQSCQGGCGTVFEVSP